MSSRYEPRRRSRGPLDARLRAGMHRQAKRRTRAALFAVALVITVFVGTASVGLPSRTEGGTVASAAGAAPTSFETTGLGEVKAPKPRRSEKHVEDLADKVQASADSLPKDSGSGKRVVFSKREQRVWLVNRDGTLDRTYKVSGSAHDNLSAGTYAVQSHTRYATSYDYASHMEYFVQFTSGTNAPIGFHDIPVSNAGALLQTIEQLGTARSSGCIRQARPDAIRLWDFAPIGTRVVVLD